jgi:hypothetical protein
MNQQPNHASVPTSTTITPCRYMVRANCGRGSSLTRWTKNGPYDPDLVRCGDGHRTLERAREAIRAVQAEESRTTPNQPPEPRP